MKKETEKSVEQTRDVESNKVIVKNFADTVTNASNHLNKILDDNRKSVILKQQEINYSDVMKLGFEEVHEEDHIYFKEHGYMYSIIQLKLAKHIYLDWSKNTRICELIRIDKHYNVKSKIVMRDLANIKEMIKFFKDK